MCLFVTYSEIGLTSIFLQGISSKYACWFPASCIIVTRFLMVLQSNMQKLQSSEFIGQSYDKYIDLDIVILIFKFIQCHVRRTHQRHSSPNKVKPRMDLSACEKKETKTGCRVHVVGSLLGQLIPSGWANHCKTSMLYHVNWTCGTNKSPCTAERRHL